MYNENDETMGDVPLSPHNEALPVHNGGILACDRVTSAHSGAPDHNGALPMHDGAQSTHNGAQPTPNGAVPAHNRDLSVQNGTRLTSRSFYTALLEEHAARLQHHEASFMHNEARPYYNEGPSTHNGAAPAHNEYSLAHNGALPMHNGAIPMPNGAPTMPNEAPPPYDLVMQIRALSTTNGRLRIPNENLATVNGDLTTSSAHISIQNGDLMMQNAGDFPIHNGDVESIGHDDDSNAEFDDLNDAVSWSTATEFRPGPNGNSPKRIHENPPRLKLDMVPDYTYLDLIKKCDKTPYQLDNPFLYERWQPFIYRFKVAGDDTILGYVNFWVVTKIQWPDYWDIDHENQVVVLLGNTMEERDQHMDETLRKERELQSFDILKDWADKVHPVYNARRQLVLSIESAGTALFGVTIYSVHLTAYLCMGGDNVWDEHEVEVWTPTRSEYETFPVHYDNTVCAALYTGEEPWDKVVEQTVEDDYFPREYVEQYPQAVGTVTYFDVKDEQMGEAALIQPECVYVYDLRMTPGAAHPDPERLVNRMMIPNSIAGLKNELRKGAFKDDCALVFIDFIIRHGFLNPRDEPEYIEIVSRLHRRLEFPTRQH